MKTNKHISIRMSEGMILYEMILVVFFTIILLLVSSCDSLTNPNTDKEQNYNPGQYQIYDKELTVSELKTAIQNYQGGSNIVYKVKGPMSNDDYNSVMDLINIKRMNDWDFYNYVGLDLSSVTGLTKISTSYYLFSLTIPSSVYEIDGFYNSQGIYNIKITSDNPNFIYEDGILYSADKTILYSYPEEKISESFEIPDGVKKIWTTAFWGANVKKITIPESVEYIGNVAIHFTNIQTLIFKDKENWFVQNYDCNIRIINSFELENIENYNWNPDNYDNTNRENWIRVLFKPVTKTVTFSQLTDEIDSYAGGDYIIYKVTGTMSNEDYNTIENLINNKRNNSWNYNNYVGLDLSAVTGLTKISYSWGLFSLTIPSSVSELSVSDGVYNVIISSDNPNFKYVDGSLYSADETILYLYSRAKTEETFEIPSKVKKISAQAFQGNGSIRNIIIPEGVIYIGSGAFENGSIQTLTYKDEENWMVLGYNNNANKVNPEDLENPANYSWNDQTQMNGICRNGLFKPETKTVTVSQLTDEIDSYNGNDYITYKVTGSMSNDEYNQINQLINNKGNNENWEGRTIVLDLSGVTGLTKISYVSWPIATLTIPKTVSEVGNDTEFSKLIITSDNPNFKYIDGSLYSPDETVLYSYSSEKSEESFIIPSTVKKVWCCAFCNNYNIQNITIPESVVYIGSSAFDNSNIQTIIFENKENWMALGNNNNANKVDSDDLENPSNYRWNNQTHTNGICQNGIFKPITKTVTVSQLTDEINSYNGNDYITYKVTGSMSNDEYNQINQLINNKGNNENWYNGTIVLDLSGVTGLTKISYVSWPIGSVTVPKTVSGVGDGTEFSKLIIPSDNPYFTCVDGVIYSEDKTVLYSYSLEKSEESFVIPSTVKKVWCRAFCNNFNIENITIPESVDYIGSSAFDNSNIQTLTFKDKENWMARGNNNSGNKVNPEDLETPANYRWNNQTQTNGICRNGIYKIQTEP